jgi:hypothetical protein
MAFASLEVLRTVDDGSEIAGAPEGSALSCAGDVPMCDEEFGNTNDYLRAFEIVRAEGIPENHVALLRAHLAAPSYTTTWARLAEAVGYPNGSSVNLQYGKFAGRIAPQLGLIKKPVDPNGRAWWLWALVRWAGEPDPDSGHTAFVLRRPAVEALRRLEFLAGAR